MSSTAIPIDASLGRTDPTDHSRQGLGWRTVLFYCHYNSFQEVAVLLMKAIRCDYTRGLALANVVHYTGCATVYSGHRERCEAVGSVLQDIGLRVQVEP